MWRVRFGRCYEPVVTQTTEWWCVYRPYIYIYIYIYIHITQCVPLKTGKFAWQNKETILFRLVFGRLNAHSIWQGLLFQRVTRLAIRWSEFVRFSQRNELTAKVCGSLVLWICQSLFFFYLCRCLKGKVNESNPHTLDKEEHSKCYWEYRRRRFAYGEPYNTRTKLFGSQGPHYQHLL